MYCALSGWILSNIHLWLQKIQISYKCGLKKETKLSHVYDTTSCQEWAACVNGKVYLIKWPLSSYLCLNTTQRCANMNTFIILTYQWFVDHIWTCMYALMYDSTLLFPYGANVFLHGKTRLTFGLFHKDTLTTHEASNQSPSHCPPSQAVTSSGNYADALLA